MLTLLSNVDRETIKEQLMDNALNTLSDESNLRPMMSEWLTGVSLIIAILCSTCDLTLLTYTGYKLCV